jgi:hypothetical protein
MADDDWSSPSSWSAGGGSMWGAPQGGMQQPYGSPYSGFGGGMAYGGGWGMQSPYGAPGGMQSPYGGMGGYGAYAMPQQQMMQASGMQAPQAQAAGAPQAAPQAAPQMTPAPGTVTPNANPIDEARKYFGDIDISGGMSQNTTFTPWTPLGNRYEGLWAGKWVDPKDHSKGKLFTGSEDELIKQQGLGPLGFDPSSEAGLARMEQLARTPNPFFAGARDAVTGITSGQNRIGTGGMFSSMYDDPGITGMGQYQDMANRPAIGNDQQYRDMINRDAVGAGQFNQLYNKPGVATKEYNDLAHQNAVGLGNYQGILQGAGGPGSLSGGMFGEVARGGRVDSNPYREKAIQDAMNQTSDQVKATMSARGRYGSDAYGDAMGRALGEVATTARMQGYDTDTAQMMQAAQARSGEDLARQGVGLQAAGGIAGAQSGNYAGRLAAMQGLTGAQSANVAQQMGAAQGLAGLQGTNAAQRLAQIQGLSGIQGQNYQAKLGALGQMNAAQQMAQQQRMAAAQGLTGVQGQNLQNRLQAAGMAPAMNQLRYDDATRMMQAGAAREAMAQQQRDFGWNQLQQYRSMLGNLPGSAGQQTQEQQQPWWQTALGIGSGIAGIWGGAGGGA